MENEPDPKRTKPEYISEAECAERLGYTRETLSRYRAEDGMPWIPSGNGPRPRVKYDWDKVVAWMDARARNAGVAPRRRGRPLNVDRRPAQGGSR